MRRNDREVTDINEILKIADKAKILHLGLFDGEYPYVIPLHYGYERKGGTLVFFMHSAVEGHKLDLIRKNPRVCVELECDVNLVSGGEIPCRYGCAFRSVVGRGTAEIVRDEPEKIRGLGLLMRNQTGRDFTIDEKMAGSVAVIKVCVKDFTAKARSMPPEV